MPTSQERRGVYVHSFPVVTASIWDKYEGHEFVKDVTVLERSVDEKGRLHSKRLLTMLGNPPRLFRPFFGRQPFFLMESVVIDMKRQTMEVETRNLNFLSFLESSAVSVYTPNQENQSHTDYHIMVKTSAFPGGAQGWGMSSVSRSLEDFVAKRLMGNVKKGEEVLNSWANVMRKICISSKQSSILCSHLTGEY